MSTLYVDNLQPNLGSQVEIPALKPISGSVVQVVQDYKTDATVYNGVDTYHNVMTVSITPKYANSKMLISSDVSYCYQNGQQQFEWYFHLNRSINGSVFGVIGAGDAAGSRQSGWFQPSGAETSSLSPYMMFGTLSGTYLDSPATTQAITYNLVFRSHTNSFYINRSVNDTDGSGYSKRLTSNLTVMEIAQ